MPTFSQNKKIAISVIAVFTVSFSVMLFFLEDNGGDLKHGETNVLHADEEASAPADTFDYADIEAAYRVYMENSRDPIFVTDPEGNFKFVSKDFCKMLEMSCSKLRDNKLFDYINSKDLSDFVAEYTKLIKNGHSVDAIGPLRIIRGDEESLVLLKAKPIINDEDEVSGIIFSAKDITKQVKELQDNNVKKDDKDGESWVDHLYPQIREMEESEVKLIVDKMS